MKKIILYLLLSSPLTAMAQKEQYKEFKFDMQEKILLPKGNEIYEIKSIDPPGRLRQDNSVIYQELLDNKCKIYNPYDFKIEIIASCDLSGLYQKIILAASDYTRINVEKMCTIITNTNNIAASTSYVLPNKIYSIRYDKNKSQYLITDILK